MFDSAVRVGVTPTNVEIIGNVALASPQSPQWLVITRNKPNLVGGEGFTIRDPVSHSVCPLCNYSEMNGTPRGASVVV